MSQPMKYYVPRHDQTKENAKSVQNNHHCFHGAGEDAVDEFAQSIGEDLIYAHVISETEFPINVVVIDSEGNEFERELCLEYYPEFEFCNPTERSEG